MREKLDLLQQKRAESEQGGGAERIATQHKKGKLTARERLDVLLDPRVVRRARPLRHPPLDRLRPRRAAASCGDGVVTGYGRIDGRLVYVFSQDFTVFGGSLSETHAEKICKVMDLAVRNGAPIIGLNDSGGARIQEGVVSLGGYADIFLRNTLASGVVPQISRDPRALRRRRGVLVRRSPTSSSWCAASSLHVRHRAQRGEDGDARGVDFEQLGGADVHGDDLGRRALRVRFRARVPARRSATLLSFLPSNNLDEPPRARPADPRDRRDEALLDVVPDNADQAVRHARRDPPRRGRRASSSRCIATTPATSLVGFARLGGRPVGRRRQSAGGAGRRARHQRVAQGARGSSASATRSTSRSSPSRMCPGFLPGVAQEHGGIIKHGAKLLYAYCEATVPEAHGDHPQGVRRGLRRDELQAHPGRLQRRLADGGDRGHGSARARWRFCSQGDRSATEAARSAEYRTKFAHPYLAAGRGFLDDVIDPRDTRPRLIDALDLARDQARPESAEEAWEYSTVRVRRTSDCRHQH